MSDKLASELLHESAIPFDAACMKVLALEADNERLRGELEAQKELTQTYRLSALELNRKTEAMKRADETRKNKQDRP